MMNEQKAFGLDAKELAQQYSAALNQINELQARLKESEAYAESLAHDICAMEDALGFKGDCTDQNGAFIPTLGPWLERARDLIAAEGELGDVKDKLQAYEQAMEREKKPEWSDDLKRLADNLERCAEYQETTWAPDMIKRAARELRYMGDSFTLKANFVPAELRIKELEAALLAWKAYFQSEGTDPELEGEEFMNAWFQMEEALKSKRGGE